MSPSPASSSKRIKLELSPSPRLTDNPAILNDSDEYFDNDHCVICLQSLTDRTVISTCSHEFCFECISLWAEQSQKCPLCSQLIGEYLIHRIRSQFDYQKHYLPPPLSKSPQLLPTGETHVRAARRARRERYWGRRARHGADQPDQLERAIAKRRWVYQNHLYAKHVASNSFTRYRPYPTPSQFSASPDMISRATIFLRRELRVWPNLDVEFLTTFTISIMKSIDIRAESAVKLLAEFLDLDAPYIEGQRHPNAEHFAHEIYCHIRSGRDLSTYDNLVQYDTSSGLPPSYEQERKSRWHYESRSRSRSPRHRHLRSRSRSRSPLSRPSSSALRAEYRRSPSTLPPKSSSDDLSSQRRRTRSVVSERQDIFGTSNNCQSQSYGVQQQSVNKSVRARGKERERDHTPPLRGGNENHSSSALPRASGENVPDGVVEAQQIAELDTFGNITTSTPPVESCLEYAVIPTGGSAPAPVYTDKDDADPEPTASASRKRPNTPWRPPRTLLESVQAHLSRNTESRQAKHHTHAGETEAAHNHLLHLSQQDRDACDDDKTALLSRLSSPPTSVLHAPPPCSDLMIPLLGESISAKESQSRRSLLADPVVKSLDEEMVFGNTAARPKGKHKDTKMYKNERISASSPPPTTDPEVSVPQARQKPKPNSNPISSPHNSNINDVEMGGYTRRGNQEAATYMKKEAALPARSRSSSDMPTLLLQRLEEERRVALRDSRTLRSASSTQADVPLSRDEDAAKALETRLRTRAVLRVRLAAIKGAANQSVIKS